MRTTICAPAAKVVASRRPQDASMICFFRFIVLSPYEETTSSYNVQTKGTRESCGRWYQNEGADLAVVTK
jgi:hypothetical protein